MKAQQVEEPGITLHYIERLHSAMLATGASINRAFVVQCICCIITLLITFGVANSGNEVSLVGLTLHVPIWLIVVGLSVVVAAIFSYLVGLSAHLLRLRASINQLYEHVGYTKPWATEAVAHPLEYPDISSVILDMSSDIDNRFIRILSVVVNLPILIIALLLFPVAAQLSVCVYLIRSFGWAWLDAVFIVLIALSLINNSVSFLLSSRPRVW